MQISIKGIDHAIRTIERYTDLRQKLAELAERLCAIGEPIIKQIHGNHSVVATEPTANGYRITASGEDVLFIEFGAGDQAGSENGNYDAVPAEARPGSWSETHAQQYSTLGYWYFGGHKFTTVAPSPAFYYAYEYMVQNLPRIAREVFGSG